MVEYYFLYNFRVFRVFILWLLRINVTIKLDNKNNQRRECRLFIGLALYLFGKIKFPHDSPIKKLSFFRISGGVLVAAFTIYLISGFRVNKETNTFKPLTLLRELRA